MKLCLLPYLKQYILFAAKQPGYFRQHQVYRVHAADMRHVPAAVKLYDQLGVKKAPLSLIPPAFETPLPPLQPATFPPCPREPPPPALELFDLDDAFAGEQVCKGWVSTATAVAAETSAVCHAQLLC